MTLKEQYQAHREEIDRLREKVSAAKARLKEEEESFKTWLDQEAAIQAKYHIGQTVVVEYKREEVVGFILKIVADYKPHINNHFLTKYIVHKRNKDGTPSMRPIARYGGFFEDEITEY